MCVYVCDLCICACVYLCVWLYVCNCVCVCICVVIWIGKCVCVYVCVLKFDMTYSDFPNCVRIMFVLTYMRVCACQSANMQAFTHSRFYICVQLPTATLSRWSERQRTLCSTNPWHVPAKTTSTFSRGNTMFLDRHSTVAFIVIVTVASTQIRHIGHKECSNTCIIAPCSNKVWDECGQ